jgi:hypothetical protein
MKFFETWLTVACALVVSTGEIGWGQSPEQAQSNAVRVTVSMHPDGSRTLYRFDNAQHKAVATITDPDGKVRETIRYELDDAGRFSSGEISGPDGRVRFKSRYKYDDVSRLSEETQGAEDGALLQGSFTVTMHQASKPVIRCSMHLANWCVERAPPTSDRLLLLKLGRKPPGRRSCLGNRQMPTITLRHPVYGRLVGGLPQPAKETTKPA